MLTNHDRHTLQKGQWKMKTLLTIFFVLTSSLVQGGDLQEKTLGIIMPFEMNQDEESIPDSFKTTFGGGMVVPREYLEFIKSKNVFKDVIEINGEEAADYYIKGYIDCIELGNGATRYFQGPLGWGLASIKENITILDSNKEKLGEKEILQKGTRAGNAKTTFSNTNNLMTAVKATKPLVFNLLLSATGNINADLIPLLTSKNYENIREAARKIKTKSIRTSTELSQAFTQAIDSYLSNPDDNKLPVDAMAWLCIAIGSSASKDNIADLEKIVASEVKGKIKGHAKKSLKKLKKTE
jgi:hypothetical protein